MLFFKPRTLLSISTLTAMAVLVFQSSHGDILPVETQNVEGSPGGDRQVEVIDGLENTLDKRQDIRAPGVPCQDNDHKCSATSPTEYVQCYRNSYILRSCGLGTKCMDAGNGRVYCVYI